MLSPQQHLGNIHIVNWSIVLEEADHFGQHDMSLSFDGVPQFLQRISIIFSINCGGFCQKTHHYYSALVSASLYLSITLPAEDWTRAFFGGGEFIMLPLLRLDFSLRIIVVIPYFVLCNKSAAKVLLFVVTHYQ